MMNEKKGCGCGSKSADKTMDHSADTTDRVGPTQSGEKIGMSEKDMNEMKNETKSYKAAAKK